MDLIVKFIFDETENTLTASLISYKRLFVFQSDTRYSQAVRFCKLRPDRLSYVVESDENARYKMVKSLRKSLSKPKRKHLFKRWITTEGLQPQPVEYKMVNDYGQRGQGDSGTPRCLDDGIGIRRKEEEIRAVLPNGFRPKIRNHNPQRPLFRKRGGDGIGQQEERGYHSQLQRLEATLPKTLHD